MALSSSLCHFCIFFNPPLCTSSHRGAAAEIFFLVSRYLFLFDFMVFVFTDCDTDHFFGLSQAIFFFPMYIGDFRWEYILAKIGNIMKSIQGSGLFN